MKKKLLFSFAILSMVLSSCGVPANEPSSSNSSSSNPQVSESSEDHSSHSHSEHSHEHSSEQSSSNSSSSSSVHYHTPSATWYSDENGHYRVCVDCGEKLNYASHTLTKSNKTVDSSCTTPGYDLESEVCSVCGYEASSVKKNIVNAASHVFELIDKKDPTCTTQGYNLYKCKTCSETYKETVSALGHDWQKGATCTDLWTCKNCDATKAAPGHHYHVKSSSNASCTEDGLTVYECENCHDEYKVVNKATGHNLDGELVFDHYQAVENKACTYKVIYRGYCSTCHESIFVAGDDEVVKHNLVTKYAKYPNCSEKGSKGNYCLDCHQYIGNMEEVAIDENAHDWEFTSENDGVKTFTCSHCDATKTVVEYNNNSANVSNDAIKNNEVALPSASLKFENIDSDSANMDLSIDLLDSGNLYLDEEDAQKLEGRPIYDFNLSDGSEKVSFGKVTIRIPYELQNGEDPDSLVVYYIDDNDNLQEVEAKYVDGYAVFETEHFSFYCVSFMSPAERCAKYGHNWGDTYEVKGDCLRDSFKYQICGRCHELKVSDYVAATGHKYVVNSAGSHDATCTKAGHTDYICSECGDSYGSDQPALGHHYVLDKEHSTDATCTTGGKQVYVCDRCVENEPGHTYTITTASTGHKYEAVTIPATCLEEGSVRYICSVCGEEDTSRRIVLEKAEHKFALDKEEKNKYIYKCEACGEIKEVSKGPSSRSLNAVTAKEDKVFTNIPASMVGESLAVTGGFEFEYVNGDYTYYVGADNAEAYVGLDENGMLVAYGKVNYTGTTGSNSSRTMPMAFYLKNNILYAESDGSYCAYDLNNKNVFGAGNSSGAIISELITNLPNIIDFAKNEVKEYYNRVIDVKGDKFNEIAFNTLNSMFDFEPAVEGYNIRLSSAKISSIIKTLKEGTLRDAIESIIGKDNVNKILDRISSYSEVSFKEALQMLKEDTGIDYLELLELVDKGVAKFSKYESLKALMLDLANVDIDEYLSDEYLSSHSFVKLAKENNLLARFIPDNDLAAFIEGTVKSYLNKKMSEIITNEDALNNFYKIVDIVDGVVKNVGFNIHILENGKLVDIDISVDTTQTISEGVSFSVKGAVSLGVGTSIVKSYDYASLKNMLDRVINVAYHDGGLDKDLASSFSNSYELTKDDNGLIIDVKETSGSYYGKEPVSDSNNRVIRTKREALQYTGYSYYKDIAKLINEEGLNDKYIKVAEKGSKYTYYTEGINMIGVTLNRACGNALEVRFIYDMIRESEYDIQTITLYGADNTALKEVTSNDGTYTYNTTSQLYFTYNPASGKFNEVGSDHDWVLSESLSHYHDVACGDNEVYTYVCVNCGAQRVNSYQVSHRNYEAVKAEFAYPNSSSDPSCYDGLIVTYKCSDCGEEFTRRTYSHVMINEKEYSLQELGLDGKFIVRSCPCEKENEYDIEGFVRKASYSYANDQYYNYIFESDELYNGEAIYIGLNFDYDFENCHGTYYVVLTSNVYKDAQNRKTQTIKISDYESHNYVTKGNNVIIPVDANDLTKGFDIEYACSRCGKKQNNHYNYHYNANINLDLGEHAPICGSRSIQVSGYIEDLYRGYADQIYPSFSDCSFTSKQIDNNLWLYSCTRSFGGSSYYDYDKGTWVVDQEPEYCNFRYFIKYNVEIDDRLNCCNLTGYTYGFGCDENGENPFIQFTRIQNRTKAHNFSDDVTQETVEFKDLGISIISKEGVCKDCGEAIEELSLDRKDDGIYTERTVVEKDGATIVYPKGYSPKTDTVECDKDTYEARNNPLYLVTISDDKGTTTIIKYFYIIDMHTVKLYEYKNVYDLDGKCVYTYESSETYDSEKGLTYSYSTETNYYASYNNQDEFKEAFKEYTLFDYDVGEFGCVSIATVKSKQIYSNGNVYENSYFKNLSLDSHRNKTYHAGSCSQPNYYTCDDCGQVTSVYSDVRGHSYYWNNETGLYVCSVCGASSFDYSSDAVLEDCSKLDETGENILIGYYIDNYHYSNTWTLASVGFQAMISISGNNYDESVLLDVEASEAGDNYLTHYIKINKQALKDAINEEVKKYGNVFDYVAVSLVPTGYSYYGYNLIFAFEELGLEGATSSQGNATDYTITVTNNLDWDSIYVYYWSYNKELVSWPGVELEYDGDNGYGKDNYKGTIPSNADFFIISDGNKNQTDDLEIDDYFYDHSETGFYWDNSGNLRYWN